MSRRGPIFVKLDVARPAANAYDAAICDQTIPGVPFQEKQAFPEFSLSDSLMLADGRIDINECVGSNFKPFHEFGSSCDFQDLNSNEIDVIINGARTPFIDELPHVSPNVDSESPSTPCNKDGKMVTETKQRKEKVNVCDLCNQTFAHRSTLRQHYQIHTGERPHKCSYCDKAFIKKFSLNQHLRLHTGDLPYKCEFCDKRFNTKANFQNHYYVHTGGFPYVCDICKAGFRKKVKLLAHYEIHSDPLSELAARDKQRKGDKNLQCDICDKIFSKPFKLKEHYRVHTGERPFKCEECGRGFSQKTLLKTHSYVHTGDYPYTCFICDKGFRDSSRLQAHFSMHHPECTKL